MTKGHYHAVPGTAEVYLCLRGEGYMLMKLVDGTSAFERFLPGRMVYVPPFWAHRTVNTGEEPLISFCVYPGEAGHNYGDIEKEGFPLRVFKRAGIDYHLVTGVLDSNDAWEEITAWVDAARVMAQLRHSSIGLMGHYYGGMLDIYSDLTQQCAHFGGHIEILEVDELAALRREVTATDIAERVRVFHEAFDVQADCPAAELERAARTSVARPAGSPLVRITSVRGATYSWASDS